MQTRFSGIIVLVIVGSSICGNATAEPKKKYPKSLFSLSAMHFDATRQPHGIDWYASSDEGKAILGSLATALGASPFYVAIAKAAIPRAHAQDEQTDYVIPLAKGYAPCAARITVKSIVPTGGDHVSSVNAAINPSKIQVSTVTPVLGATDGRSWAEGDVAYYGIKRAYLQEFIRKGVCKKVTTQTGFMSCSGSAACSAGASYGSPDKAAQSTAAIRKR